MDIDSVQSKSLPVNSRNEEGTVASPRLLTVPFSVLDDDICSQDLMEVDVHTSLQASGATTSGLLQSSLHQGVQRGRSSRVSCVLQTTRKTLPSAGTMHQVTGVTPVSPFNRNFLLHAAFVASKDIREDATGAVGMSPVPTPPVAVVTRSDITSWPNLKLHELFARWLLKPENCVWISVLLSDICGGKSGDLSAPSQVQARANYAPAPPGSPVSRLIHHHLPFDGSPRLHRHSLALSMVNHAGPASSALSGAALPYEISQSPVEFSDSVNPQDYGKRKDFNLRTNDRGTTSHPPNGEDDRHVGPDSRDLLEDRKRRTHSSNVTDLRGTSAGPPPALPHVGPGCEKKSDLTHSLSRAMPSNLEQFYFPCGRGSAEREAKEMESISAIFANRHDAKGFTEGLARTDFAVLVSQALSLPTFLAPIVFDRVLDASIDSRERSNFLTPTHTLAHARNFPLHEAPQDCGDPKRASSHHDENVYVEGDGVAISCVKRSDEIDGDVKPMNIDSGAKVATQHCHSRLSFVTEDLFRRYYQKEAISRCREERLFRVLLPGGEVRDYLTPSDFKAMLRALLVCHQGLSFLHATPEFQLRYSETVIERIFFSCSRTHSGRLTLQDIKRSQLLDTLMMVDEEEDINRERKYFSYEHFYVLYCRFWELDVDHDLQIDREDLMRYGGHSLTYRIVDRIFGGYARRLDSADHPGFMSYTDFIWFCLSEEDKSSETAVDYWFRCVDMDGDGLITMYDMEYFYKEQLHRMECFGHEPVQIRDILCQLLDMVKPNSRPPHIKRSDLKSCRLAGSFFNVLFNLNKFFALEARDPLQIRQEHATPELTDWDRFAALEYLRLSAEEEGEEEEAWEEVHDSINPAIPGEAPF